MFIYIIATLVRVFTDLEKSGIWNRENMEKSGNFKWKTWKTQEFQSYFIFIS